jgi:hypothetical protein
VAVVRDGRVVLSGRSDDLLGEARRGQSSEIHVNAADARVLDGVGIAHERSRFPGLILLRSPLADDELLAILARERIVPRRIEPKVSMLSLYLDAAHDGGDP